MASRRWRCLFYLLLLLPVILVAAGVFWLVATEGGSVFLLEQGLQQVQKVSGFTINLEGISGTFSGTLQITSLRIVLPRAGLRLQCEGVGCRFGLGALLQQKIRIQQLVCRDCRIEGPLSAFSLPTLPPLPSTACLAAPDGHFLLDSLSFQRLSWVPADSSMVELVLENLSLALPAANDISATKTSGKSLVQTQITGFYRNRPFFNGNYTGSVATSGRQIDGSLSSRLLGGSIATSLAMRWTRKDWRVSGDIDSLSLSLASFSQWLQPLWQDGFPFGLEGDISAAGPWMFTPELGWCGNLQGNLTHGRFVALGLFYSLMDLETSWRLFDGVFQCLEPRLSILGFPADLTLRLENVFTAARHWTCELVLAVFPLERWLISLPWNIRYLFPHYRMTGSLSMDLRAQGVAPTVRGRLKGQFEIVEQSLAPASASFTVNYSGEGLVPGKVEGSIQWGTRHIPPMLWSTARANGFSSLPEHGPVAFTGSFSGSMPGHVAWQGRLTDAEGSAFNLSATMSEGAWTTWRWTDLGNGRNLPVGDKYPSLGQFFLLQP